MTMSVAVDPPVSLRRSGTQFPGQGLPGHAARLARRVATGLTQPVVQEVATLVRPDDFRESPLWTDPPFDAGGLPVLLLGGFASTPQTLSPMSEWLERLNCRPAFAPIRYGVDCGERTALLVADALAELADSHGSRCALVAHSRVGSSRARSPCASPISCRAS